MKTKIIGAIAIIIIIIVAIAAYAVSVSSNAANPNPSATPLTSPLETLPNATISIQPSTTELQTATVGQIIEVNVTIDNVQELWGWDFVNITFNPSVLNLTQVVEGPLLKSGGTTFFLSTLAAPATNEGNLQSVCDALTENTTVSGAGTLATLRFSVISAGTSQITLNGAQLLTPYVLNAVDWATGTHVAINNTIVNGKVVISSLSP